MMIELIIVLFIASLACKNDGQPLSEYLFGKRKEHKKFFEGKEEKKK